MVSVLRTGLREHFPSEGSRVNRRPACHSAFCVFHSSLPFCFPRLWLNTANWTLRPAAAPLPSSREDGTLSQSMSTLMEIEEAAAQLPSPDFVQLLEDLHDLATARVALGELTKDPTATVGWDQLKRELDVLHG